MTITFKQRASRGFTLIELLIVVIILAILAAIAIPQFSASTNDAQSAARDSNLATVRSALELYKVQHKDNAYPGKNASAAAAGCTGGDVVTGAVGEVAMKAQLMYYTDADGNACKVSTTNHKFGPYLRQGIPVEPVSNVPTVTVSTTGAAAPVTTGWSYSTVTGEFNAPPSATPATGS